MKIYVCMDENVCMCVSLPFKTRKWRQKQNPDSCLLSTEPPPGGRDSAPHTSALLTLGTEWALHPIPEVETSCIQVFSAQTAELKVTTWTQQNKVFKMRNKLICVTRLWNLCKNSYSRGQVSCEEKIDIEFYHSGKVVYNIVINILFIIHIFIVSILFFLHMKLDHGCMSFL